MVYDLLSPKNDVLNYELTDQQGKKTPKSTMLSDTDELFLKYRYSSKFNLKIQTYRRNYGRNFGGIQEVRRLKYNCKGAERSTN
jgi:hypothetical protein